MTEAISQIRIDKWLWYARQTKSRSLAQKLVSAGGVRLNGTKIASASKNIAPGDVLTLALPASVKVLRVLECGKKRGPFEEARTLYEDLSPPVVKQPRLSNAQKGLPTAHGRPEGRERKIARRLSGKE